MLSLLGAEMCPIQIHLFKSQNPTQLSLETAPRSSLRLNEALTMWFIRTGKISF